MINSKYKIYKYETMKYISVTERSKEDDEEHSVSTFHVTG